MHHVGDASRSMLHTAGAETLGVGAAGPNLVSPYYST